MFLIEESSRHFRAAIEKRVEDVINHYSRSPDLLVFVEGPRWATVGFERVAKGWRDFADAPIRILECKWVENLQSKVAGEMGFVAGVCQLKIEIKGELQIVRFRGTFVLQKEADGEWRIVHEHFSQPAADPYGIGDWLKNEEEK
jgi:ketosteroid isomerase-like protein